jgi:integrase
MPVVRELLTAMPRSATRARLGVMAFTGLRPEELRRIRPEDLDLEAG